MLEPDFGDAWGKRIARAGYRHGRFLLACCSAIIIPLVEASDHAIRWTGRYTGGDPKVKRLTWTVTASRLRGWPAAGIPHRGGLGYGKPPPARAGAGAVQRPAAAFEVPFGFRERTFDRGKLDFSIWNSNTQEFPTLHWVRKAVDATQRGGAVQ